MRWSLSAFLFALTGCALVPSSPPTHYYLLPDPPPCKERNPFGGTLVIADPVVPAYLDRSELLLVHRKGSVAVDRFRKLLEPYDRAVQRLLILSLRSGISGTVVPAPARGRKLEVRLLRFHLEAERGAVVEALWRLDRGRWREERIAVTPSGAGVGAKLQALSRVVGELGCRIARKIGKDGEKSRSRRGFPAPTTARATATGRASSEVLRAPDELIADPSR